MCLLVLAAATAPLARTRAAHGSSPWLRSFEVDTRGLSTVGENPYFILKPGEQLTLGDEKTGGHEEQLVITVLDETTTVGGVETRVVEERETKGGVPVEVSRNYYAIDPRTNDVFYFGEDVDMYTRGKVSGHDGGWHHGASGARFGLMMPGAPAVGSRYYQEQAPGVAMDRAEVVSLADRATTPAGTFERCLRTRETTPLEAFVKEYKVYAPGVGLIRDGSLHLVAHTSSAAPSGR
jgi:hypothetical protein